MTMPLETTLIYNESLIRQAVFAYWRRTVGGFFVPVLVALAAWLVMLVAQRDLSWVTGLVGSAVGFGVIMSASVYVVHYRNTMAKFRDLQDPAAKLIADDHALTVESSIGTASIHWSAVTEVWKFEHVWLLLFSKAHFSTLPVANLSPDLQHLIIRNVRSAGGKIV